MNIFNQVRANKPGRTVFDLSHENKLSMDMGYLVPILCTEAVPGDKFRLSSESFVRFAPMLAPIMHRVDVTIHHWFVPYRLIHDNWEKFITGGEDGNDETVPPYIQITDNEKQWVAPCTLADYLGLPVIAADEYTVEGAHRFSAYPFRAYQLIYNEFYRDENLCEKIPISKEDGLDPNLKNLMTMRLRAWEKDYFTSALPFAQKGAEVQIPIQGSAEVKVDWDAIDPGDPATWTTLNHPDGSPSTPGAINHALYPQDPEGLGNQTNIQSGVSGEYGASIVNPNGTLYADLQAATASTINDLRKAFQLQRWLERNARAGSRYVESILAHFGVISPDARLQRPEYLGGGKTPVMISEVLQTSETAGSAQGNMAGHGISVGRSNSFTKFFQEHGIVMSIMSVMPRSAYQQGVSKMWFRFDKFDYYWPEFAHLGEQAVQNKELYLDYYDTSGNNDATFGYQSRYSEYKFIPSQVHGDFKNSLLFWHMGRVFANAPTLSQEFIEMNPTKGANRVFATEFAPVNKLWVQVYHNFQAIRPMPKFGEPGLIDHG